MAGPLGLLVERLWFSSGGATPGREHTLPSGRMHVAIRLDDVPLRLYADDADAEGRLVGSMTLAGARAGYCVKESAAARVVGAQLRPGAATALFGMSAAELTARHVPLPSLWPDAGATRDELGSLSDPAAMLALLGRALSEQVGSIRAMHPDVAAALERWDGDTPVASLVEESSLSHRHFTAQFRDATGLSPKRYGRVRRFRRVLAAAHRDPGRSWAQLAAEGGYADQAHLTREFVEFAGTTPAAYRAARPREELHLPVGR
ncbi:MAG: hypothetical protein AMXMBFR46_18310 [Acidimicrobiia bacterium]